MITKSAIIATVLVINIYFNGATAKIIDKAAIVVNDKMQRDTTWVNAPTPTAIPAEQPTINNKIEIIP